MSESADNDVHGGGPSLWAGAGEGSQLKAGLSTLGLPARPCSLHSDGDEGLTGGFDAAAADGEAAIAQGRVPHAVRLVVEVGEGFVEGVRDVVFVGVR